MTIVYYSYFDKNISKELFENRITDLPEVMAREIRKFERWQDALASLYGKIILENGLKEFKVAASLADVLYSKYGKPYLRVGSLGFNISHSGNYVVCAISDETSVIGVDVQQILEVDINEFRGVWTKGEWFLISNSNSRCFFELWARKEAVLKANGSGLSLQLNRIDVRDSTVILENKSYFLNEIRLQSDYVLFLASIKRLNKIDLIKFSF